MSKNEFEQMYIKRFINNGIIETEKELAEMYSLANEVFRLYFPNAIPDDDLRFKFTIMYLEGALYQNTLTAIKMVNRFNTKTSIMNLTGINESVYNDILGKFESEEF